MKNAITVIPAHIPIEPLDFDDMLPFVRQDVELIYVWFNEISAKQWLLRADLRINGQHYSFTHSTDSYIMIESWYDRDNRPDAETITDALGQVLAFNRDELLKAVENRTEDHLTD